MQNLSSHELSSTTARRTPCTTLVGISRDQTRVEERRGGEGRTYAALSKPKTQFSPLPASVAPSTNSVPKYSISMNAPPASVGSHDPNSYGVNSIIGEVRVALSSVSTRLSVMMIGKGARESAKGRTAWMEWKEVVAPSPTVLLPVTAVELLCGSVSQSTETEEG